MCSGSIREITAPRLEVIKSKITRIQALKKTNGMKKIYHKLTQKDQESSGVKNTEDIDPVDSSVLDRSDRGTGLRKRGRGRRSAEFLKKQVVFVPILQICRQCRTLSALN